MVRGDALRNFLKLHARVVEPVDPLYTPLYDLSIRIEAKALGCCR